MEQNSTLSGRDFLVALSRRHGGSWDPIYHDIREKVTDGVSAYLPTDKDLNGWSALTILDGDAYPQKLRDKVVKPPFVLYFKGNLHNLDVADDALLLISPKTYNYYSAADAMVRAARDAKIPVVILWNGPDPEMSNNGYALDALRVYQWSKVPFTVVIPSSCKDPQALADEVAATGGLAIMEAFPGSERRMDPMFGRIGTGLAKAALVLGGTPSSSGTLMAVSLALNAGMDVGALAWPAFSEGGKVCHDLIREGALCVSAPEDLFTLIGREEGEKKLDA